jgi:hypothetical protein
MMNKKANLNQAFKELRKLGYFARQNFWCCQSCAWAAVPMDAKKVVFYHRQDTEELNKTGECYLAWSGDRDEIAEVLERNGVLKTKPENESQRFEIKAMLPKATQKYTIVAPSSLFLKVALATSEEMITYVSKNCNR